MKYFYAIVGVILGLALFSETVFAADQWEDVTPTGSGGTVFNSVVSIQDFVYAASDDGVYFSNDHGDSWSQINTGLGNLDIRSIAIGWVYDYAAQGGFGGYVYDSNTPILVATANGIYSSVIASSTWSDSMTGLTDTDVRDIEFDIYETTDGGLYTLTVYASTPSGVFRSDDNGASWSLQNTNMSSESVKRIATDWSNGTIFAVTDSNKVYTSTLYSASGYSADESWSLEFSDPGTTTEDINLLDPNGGNFWLATNKGILKSDISGTNWQTVNIGLGTSTVNSVSSDHYDPNIAYAALSEHGVYRTNNEAIGTPQWLPVNSGLTDLNIKDVQTNAGTDLYVFAVSDSGIFRLTVTDPYGDMTPPETITDLSAVVSTTSVVELTWTAPGDDVSYGTAYSYDIRYSDTILSEANWDASIVAQGTSTPQSAGTSESLEVTVPVAGTTYYFGVKTLDEGGNVSGLSNIAIAITDTIDPTVPSDLVATSSVATEVDLAWTASTDNIGVDGYKVLRGLGVNTPVEVATVNGTTYNDTGLDPLTEYTYALIAYDAAGNLSATSATSSVYTVASAPSGFSAVDISTSQIDLSWDTTAENIEGYRLYRNSSLIGTLSSSTVSYSDTGLSDDTSYTYDLVAYDERGFSSVSSSWTGSTEAVSTGGGGGGGSSRTDRDEEVVEDDETDPVIPDTTEPETFPITEVSSVIIYTFNNNLSPGDDNEEVRKLQIALNALGYTVSSSGVGSPGNESTYFGELTILALQAFQREKNIVFSGSPATTGYGNFGPATRSALNVAYSNFGGGPVTSNDDLRLSLIAKINELTKLIESLKQELSMRLATNNIVSQNMIFQTTLKVGDTGEEVRALQKKLNSLGIIVAESGVGSPGNESAYFGSLTVDAIKRFQCTYNIVCSGSPTTTGYGSFGQKTRSVINSL